MSGVHTYIRTCVLNHDVEDWVYRCIMFLSIACGGFLVALCPPRDQAVQEMNWSRMLSFIPHVCMLQESCLCECAVS